MIISLKDRPVVRLHLWLETEKGVFFENRTATFRRVIKRPRTGALSSVTLQEPGSRSFVLIITY